MRKGRRNFNVPIKDTSLLSSFAFDLCSFSFKKSITIPFGGSKPTSMMGSHTSAPKNQQHPLTYCSLSFQLFLVHGDYHAHLVNLRQFALRGKFQILKKDFRFILASTSYPQHFGTEQRKEN